MACTLFGGVAGSPLADVSAMGSVMIPMMKKEGYHADYAVNVTTHAALVGALMPTSHNIIIYHARHQRHRLGQRAGPDRRMPDPGGHAHICNLAAAYLVAVKRGYPRRHFAGWHTWRALAAAAARPVHGLLILGGILSGVFTATESAAMAVLWAQNRR